MRELTFEPTTARHAPMPDDPRQDLDRERAVAAYYNRLAPVYGEGEYFRARRAAVVAAIAAELANARTVLDLGCGNGAYVAEFTRRAPTARIVGADLSPEMLQAARGRARQEILLVRADATALPFRHSRFDLVFMSHVLQLVAGIERCVSEVTRALVPGGVLAATAAVSRWRDLMGEFLSSEDWRELESVFGSGLRAVGDDETRMADACIRVGLQPEWRRAQFSVNWPAVEQWVRIRWLTIADDALRARAEEWLARVRPRAAGLTLEFTETLMVAHRA